MSYAFINHLPRFKLLVENTIPNYRKFEEVSVLFPYFLRETYREFKAHEATKQTLKETIETHNEAVADYKAQIADLKIKYLELLERCTDRLKL